MKKIVAKDKEHLSRLIKYEIEKNGNRTNLNHIDISQITDLSRLFYNSKFNGDISKWNVSQVKDMSEMFARSYFNRNISGWDVSNVRDMSRMFEVSVFKQDLSSWDISSVKYMDNIFNGCQIKRPYWYIEDNKERLKEFEKKKMVKQLKKKIECHMKDIKDNDKEKKMNFKL